MPRRLRLVLPSLLLALHSTHAEPARTPRQLIDALGTETRQILESPKPVRKPGDAERVVAERITALAASSPGDDALIDADEQGRTPLMQAVDGSYPLVVKALLADPIVTARINARNQAGETAWMLASFAPSLTLVACQPGALTLDRYPLLPPYLRRMADLLNGKETPDTAAAIVRQLEQAGASVDPAGARRAWLARCPNTPAELRREIVAKGERNDASNLLPTLVGAAISSQMAFNKTYRDGLSTIPQKPPQDMRFVPLGDERRTQQDMKCRRAQPPTLLGALSWSGSMVLKGRIATRAGVVEVADFEVVSPGDPAPAVVDYFRSAIVRALSRYQCEGDHVFAQEFQFKVE